MVLNRALYIDYIGLAIVPSWTTMVAPPRILWRRLSQGLCGMLSRCSLRHRHARLKSISKDCIMCLMLCTADQPLRLVAWERKGTVTSLRHTTLLVCEKQNRKMICSSEVKLTNSRSPMHPNHPLWHMCPTAGNQTCFHINYNVSLILLDCEMLTQAHRYAQVQHDRSPLSHLCISGSANKYCNVFPTLLACAV